MVKIKFTHHTTNNTNQAELPSNQFLGKRMWQQLNTFYFLQNSHTFLGDFGTYFYLGTFQRISEFFHHFQWTNTTQLSTKQFLQHTYIFLGDFGFTFHFKPTHFGTDLKRSFLGYQPK